MHQVVSADGTSLHVRGYGPEAAPALLMIHGWSQHSICWDYQVRSALTKTHRVITFDLRGHGMSDRPQDASAYRDGRYWADDIHAILSALTPQQPIVVGWSYGSRVIAEYLERYGDSSIAGVVTVGGILATGAAREDWMMGADSPALNRDLYTDDQPRLIDATMQFTRAAVANDVQTSDLIRLTAAAMLVPPFVRRAMFQVDRDLRPIYAKLTRPALIIHGREDQIVAPACAEALTKTIPGARLALYSDTGHIPFIEVADRFNADLAAFAAAAQTVETKRPA